MTETRQYEVTGMTCAHCERAVREEVGAVAGVETIDVNATTGALLVTTTVPSTPLVDAAVLAAVEEAGYEAARIR